MQLSGNWFVLAQGHVSACPVGGSLGWCGLCWSLQGHPIQGAEPGYGLKPLAQLDFERTREKGNGKYQTPEPWEEKEKPGRMVAATAEQLQLEVTK